MIFIVFGDYANIKSAYKRLELTNIGIQSGVDMSLRFWAVLAGIGTIAIYALQFVAIRFSLAGDSVSGLTPLDLTLIRVITSVIFFLPFLRAKHIGELKKVGWKTIGFLTLIAGAPYPFLINLGAQFSPASHAATILPPSIVFFSFLIGGLMFKARLSTKTVLSLTPIVLGIWVIGINNIMTNTAALTGDMIFFAIGSMFALFTLSVRHLKIDPLSITAGIAIASLPLLPIAMIFLPSNLGQANIAEVAGQALIQGMLSGSIGLFLFIFCARHLGAQTASLFLVGIPTTTAILGAFVLNEIPTSLELTAILLMAVGCGFPIIEKMWRSVWALKASR